MPLKCRASGHDAVVVDAAPDDHVDLHRSQPGVRGRVDAVEHARDGEADVVHRAEDRVVERVEADGHAVQARVARALRPLAASSEPLVVSVDVEAPRPGEHRHQLARGHGARAARRR